MRVLLTVSVLFVCGCASLIKGPYDTPYERTAKSLRRAALDICTLGTAEIFVGRRSRQYGNHWSYWYDRQKLAHATQSARTLEELSRLFGGIPECSIEAPDRLCQWTADSRTYSMITSGFWIYNSSVQKSDIVQSGGEFYRIICSVPADGSERAPESCTHYVNGVRYSEEEFTFCFGRWGEYCPRYQDVVSGAASRRWERSKFVLEHDE